MVETFNYFTYGVGEDTRLVVIAVCVDRVYAEIFPHRIEEGIPFLEEWFEIN